MRNRVAILTVTAVLPLTAVASFTAANQAAADPRSGEVVVTGTVEDCDNGQSPTSVKITLNTNPAQSVTDQNGGVQAAGAYAVTFNNVPKGQNNNGVKATALVSCASANYTDNFRVKRPTTTGDLVQKQDIQSS